jgi:pimeloyl-ACP methyl ester carboxylesterase/DNA-binding winged helix-turn-helix (wHTH) protein
MAQYVFGSFLLDIAERRLLRNGEDVRLRGKAFETLSVLVENSGRLVRKDELMRAIWPDTSVEENNLDHCISQIRKILGKNEDLIETVPRQGYRFKAPIAVSPFNATIHQVPERKGPVLSQNFPKQEIQFFNASDGVKIAYSLAGSGPPLVKAANWLNHLDFEWQSPIWTHWVDALTKHHTFVHYDERGNGLSDWNIQDFSFPAWVRDLEQLVDTIKLERFPVLGISQGAAVAVAYAVRNPERVSKLILFGPFSQGFKVRGSARQSERWEALLTLVRLGWGKDNPAFRQLWSTMFIPDATQEQFDSFNELQRVTTSPDNAATLLLEMGKIDVLDLLPEVKCPTLVLHSRHDSVIPIKEGRLIASRIPGAKFVELPGRGHLVMPHEPAWNVLIKALGEFMEWDTDGRASSTVQRGGV